MPSDATPVTATGAEPRPASRVRRARRAACWRRHGVIRPSAAGLAVALFGAGFWYAGLLLDDRALMAAALTLTIIWGLSLVLIVTQWALLRRQANAAPAKARWLRRLRRVLSPRCVIVRDQYERLDQSGAMLERHVGDLPGRRGLYRRVSSFVRWRDPFGLFAASRVLRRGEETAVLPHGGAAADPVSRMADRRLQGQDHADDTGGVRAYVPGDPPKLISWKATAHRGDLMTRETGRDVRTSAIVALDLHSPGVTEAHVDAEAERVLPWLAQSGAEHRLIVTDGMHVAEDRDHAVRLLAAAVPSGGAGDARGAEGPDRTGDANGVDDVGGKGGKARSDSPEGMRVLAVRIAELASRQHRVTAIRLMTPQPQGPFAAALRRTVDQGRLRIVETAQTPHAEDGRPDTASSRGVTVETARLADPVPAVVTLAHGDAEPAAPRKDSTPRKTGTSRKAGTPHIRDVRRAPWRPGAIDAMGRILTAAALLTFFAISLAALTGLVAGTGYWPWFAGAALAIVAIESNIPASGGMGYALRTCAVILADLLAAAVIVVIRAHDICGIWLSAMPDPADIGSRTIGEGQFAQPLQPLVDSPRHLLSALVADGFQGLNRQLPPVSVDAYGDLVLVIAVAAVVAVIRVLLAARRTAPAFALLPAVLLAADYALVGHQSDWWRIGATVVAFLISLWSVRPQRALAPLPLVAGIVSSALVLALTPPAVDFAYAVPLSIGDSAGLLSANTINPMVDLKRSLSSGSQSVVLTYQAPGRTYLRMTTLDDFDGDTWSFDEQLAKDGNFYGSGIQLGLDGDDTIPDYQRMAYYDNPLSMYLYAMDFDGFAMAVACGGDGSAPWSGASSSAPAFTNAASIRIESLRSRFLPVPGVTNYLHGIGGDWLVARSTIYNRASTTAQGMEYAVSGIGLDPITSDSGIRQIGSVDAMRRQLEQRVTTADVLRPERARVRHAAVSQGIATAYRHWMLVPLSIGRDGTVTDRGGSVVGSATIQIDGISNLILSQAFKDRFIIGDDETTKQLMSRDGSMVLVLPLPGEDGAGKDGSGKDESGSSGLRDLGSYADRYGSDGESGGSDGGSSGGVSTEYYDLNRELADLMTSGGYSDVISYGGTRTFDANFLRFLLDMADAMGDDARRQYRSLPKDLPDNVTALVDRARAEGVATDGDGYDHQVAAMQWLVKYFTNPDNGFAYSLDAPDGDGRGNMQVIDDFLAARQGYCTHYASALAVLGRAMGVPTRMVLGYNKGVGGANADGRYEVMARQLHAWVEAYIDGVGWVPFDVTPASPDNGSAVEAGADTNAGGGTGAEDLAGVDSTQEGDGTPDVGADANDGGQRNRRQNRNTRDDGSSVASEKSGSGTSVLEAFGVPFWARVALWSLLAVVAAALLTLIPAGISALRRRRRLRAIEASPGARAWGAAWAEILDCAWDTGVRWRASDTDLAIGGMIAGYLTGAGAVAGSGADAGVDADIDTDTDAAAFVRLVAERVAALAFGAGSAAERGDTRRLRTGLAMVRTAFREARRGRSPFSRLVATWFPASVIRGIWSFSADRRGVSGGFRAAATRR